VINVGNLLHDSGVIADLSVLNYGFAPALLHEAVMTTVVVTLHVMKLRRQREELDAERNQLSAIASTDHRIELPNRRAFSKQFDDALAKKWTGYRTLHLSV
jgi:predicted signal transduction protein with EAL and GGDEF domain